MLSILMLIGIGISGGIVTGTAVAAFLTLLDIIPRLSQVTNTSRYVIAYERTIVFSTVIVSLASFLGLGLYLNRFFLIPIGFTIGAFIGLLAAALAEVVNVIPVLERRLKLEGYMIIPLLAISLGKVVGSLLDWLIFSK